MFLEVRDKIRAFIYIYIDIYRTSVYIVQELL